ncbi:hypothetical protein [Mariniphaga sediminis]|uniref:hypothetical protein n=1 Tax=Mariniphaga sediminis TaxID=1628158 RepID=UPI001558EE86|nr:hypothetical protein [Mariniphaga sediminis]
MGTEIVKKMGYSGKQIFALTFLRVLIGWHFLYEGLVKIYTPGWSAGAYLEGATGPFSGLFKNLAQQDVVLSIVDLLNAWGLALVGFGLFVGLFSKACKIFGILLLALYYMAYPPFAGLDQNVVAEGSYWIVNKNLIEIGALVVLLVFPSSYITGLDKYLSEVKNMISGRNKK